MRTVFLWAKSTPVRPSMNVVTKWRRVCSPSVTMSMPACSWSKRARRTASCLAEASASPSSFHGAHSATGSASQVGFGRLPAIVVCNRCGIGVLLGVDYRRRRNEHTSTCGAIRRKSVRPLDQHRHRPYAFGRSCRFAFVLSFAPMPKILYADNNYPDIDLERALFDPIE